MYGRGTGLLGGIKTVCDVKPDQDPGPPAIGSLSRHFVATVCVASLSSA